MVNPLATHTKGLHAVVLGQGDQNNRDASYAKTDGDVFFEREFQGAACLCRE